MRQEQDDTWHKVLIDLRVVKDPGHVSRINEHMGLNPDMVYSLTSLPVFKEEIIDGVEHHLGDRNVQLKHLCRHFLRPRTCGKFSVHLMIDVPFHLVLPSSLKKPLNLRPLQEVTFHAGTVA